MIQKVGTPPRSVAPIPLRPTVAQKVGTATNSGDTIVLDAAPSAPADRKVGTPTALPAATSLHAALAAAPTPLAHALRVILSGPPGAGKSTHGELLAKQFDVPHISMGDLLREETERGTDMGKQIAPIMQRGDLVPAPVVAAVLHHRLDQEDAAGGFILDGFPRRLDDARALEDYSRAHGFAPIPMIEIDVPESEVLQRVQYRRICADGHTVDIKDDPPRVPDRCDQDGTPLTRRPDDDPAVVHHRFEVYHAQTQPVLDDFQRRGLLRMVSGVGSIADVDARVQEAALEATGNRPSGVA